MVSKKCLIFTKYINGKKNPNSNMYIVESVGEDIKKQQQRPELEQEKKSRSQVAIVVTAVEKTYLDLIIRQDGALFLSSC